MSKEINIIGANPKRIEVLDQPKRRIDPLELAAALGAKLTDQRASLSMDLIELAEIGTQLINRLRSSGGRPALTDATVNCRVPLSAEDMERLENIVAQIGGSTNTRPSVGQLASVIVHRCLAQLESNMNTGIDLATIGNVEANLPTWKQLFPNIPDLPEVVTRAKFVAQREMPLMMADAA